GEANLTLQAESKGYTIVFHKNDGTGNDTTISHVVGENQSYTMPSDLFENGVHEFVEWNLLADGSSQTKYQSGATVQGLAQAGATIDLYAQWTHTVTFKLTPLNVKYIGYVVTNDTGLSLGVDSGYAQTYFTSTSLEDANKEYLLREAVGSTPIKDALNETRCYYKEVYYDNTSSDEKPYTTTEEVAPNTIIFVFNHYFSPEFSGSSCFNYWSSYTNNSDIGCTTTAFRTGHIVILKYVMPNIDVVIEATATTVYAVGGGAIN
ncbi:MAG: InlB B-repeat-containing protein, partial [Clostridia bacterium]|nr:InlB B-repeat-containing protein [Clostridia bacterium]